MVTLVEQIASLRRTLVRLMTRRLSARTEIPLTELRALKAIHGKEAETQAELANRLLMDAPAMSRLVDRLEARGLLVRRPGQNRRCVCLSVTEDGRELVRILESELKAVEKLVLQHLSAAERDLMKTLAGKLETGLHEFSDEVTGSDLSPLGDTTKTPRKPRK